MADNSPSWMYGGFTTGGKNKKYTDCSVGQVIHGSELFSIHSDFKRRRIVTRRLITFPPAVHKLYRPRPNPRYHHVIFLSRCCTYCCTSLAVYSSFLMACLKLFGCTLGVLLGIDHLLIVFRLGERGFQSNEQYLRA